jgi:sirohydrochlorin cobaltochelatase
VVVVPFFISDGLHSYEDIPQLLGIAPETKNHEGNGEDVFRRNPYQVRGRKLYYAGALGTDPRFADAIIEQALNAGSLTHARA